jgi:hypothetical protein
MLQKTGIFSRAMPQQQHQQHGRSNYYGHIYVFAMAVGVDRCRE